MTTTALKEMTITRILNAPREMVFKAWTDAKQLAQWWGPNGFTAPLCEVDVRPGGSIRIDMSGPDGWLMEMGGHFIEIIENKKLVFITTGFNDEKGNPTLENKNTVTFEDEGAKTKLTVHVAILKAEGAVLAMEGMDKGWSESLDRFEGLFN